MGVELFSNVLQTVVAVITAGIAMVWRSRYQKVEYAFVAGFLCAFATGIAYWLTYQLVYIETPQIFYVADLAWIAAYCFILCLEQHVTSPQAKGYRHWLMYIPFVIAMPLTIYFCTWGAVVVTVLDMGILSYGGYMALRNLLYTREAGVEDPYKGIHIFCLAYMLTEFALWLSSCFWISDTMTNPYFWFDFAITGELIWLLVATKKAVQS